jgi:hypothetical protein
MLKLGGCSKGFKFGMGYRSYPLAQYRGIFFPSQPLYSGIVGYEINLFLTTYIGRIRALAGLTFFFLCFLVIKLGLTPEKIKNLVEPSYGPNKKTKHF